MVIIELLGIDLVKDKLVDYYIDEFSKSFRLNFDDKLVQEIQEITKLGETNDKTAIYIMPHLLLFMSRYFERHYFVENKLIEGTNFLREVIEVMIKMLQYEERELFGTLEWVEGLVEIISELFSSTRPRLDGGIYNTVLENLIFITTYLFESDFNVRAFLTKYSNVYPQFCYDLFLFSPSKYSRKCVERILAVARNIDSCIVDNLEKILADVRQNIEQRPQLTFVDDFHVQLSPQNFRIIKMIGQGGNGNVYLVKSKNLPGERHFALKVLSLKAHKTPKILQRYNTERQVYTRTNHPFILSLHYCFSTQNHLYLLLQYCPGGDFYRFLKTRPHHRLSENDSRFYCSEILIALQYIHVKGYVYRDLKPENIFIHSSGHLILGDFDLCKETEPYDMYEAYNGADQNYRSRMTTLAGTPDYLSPQIAKQESYTRAVDWWCFGVLLYEMLYGRTPFGGSTFGNTIDNIVNHHVEFPKLTGDGCFLSSISSSAKDLITKLLVKDEKDRLSDSLKIMAHPFFKKIKFALIRNVVPPWIPQLKSPEDTEYFYNYDHIKLNDSIEDLHEQFPQYEKSSSHASDDSSDCPCTKDILRTVDKRDPFEFKRVSNPHWQHTIKTDRNNVTPGHSNHPSDNSE